MATHTSLQSLLVSSQCNVIKQSACHHDREFDLHISMSLGKDYSSVPSWYTSTLSTVVGCRVPIETPLAPKKVCPIVSKTIFISSEGSMWETGGKKHWQHVTLLSYHGWKDGSPLSLTSLHLILISSGMASLSSSLSFSHLHRHGFIIQHGVHGLFVSLHPSYLVYRLAQQDNFERQLAIIISLACVEQRYG